MASIQRRLIATLAVAALLAAGLPGADFAGGSDEPGYTGGSSSTNNNPGSPGTGSGSGGGSTPAPAPAPTPGPVTTNAHAESGPTIGAQGVLNRLVGYWLTIETALTFH